MNISVNSSADINAYLQLRQKQQQQPPPQHVYWPEAAQNLYLVLHPHSRLLRVNQALLQYIRAGRVSRT